MNNSEILDTQAAYTALIGNIIRDGLAAQGAEYVRGPCGRWWCEVAGIDPAAVFHSYYKLELRKEPPVYEPAVFCNRCKRTQYTPDFPKTKKV